MEYLDMVMKLQTIYDGKIILISCGAFYIAIGADAIILNKELELKLNCAKKNICKVGVPKNSINKYIKLLDGIGYSYIVLDYDKKENEIIKKLEKSGKRRENYVLNNKCNQCNNSNFINQTEYNIALTKYIKKEFGEDCIC